MQSQAYADGADAAAVQRKQKKRLQNRLNQRARRVRMKGSDTATTKTPYQTDRWRLDEVESTSEPLDHDDLSSLQEYMVRFLHNNSIRNNKLVLPLSKEKLCASRVDSYGQQLQTMIVSVPTPSPVSDHLLHLVNYNAFRGFFSNKYMLSKLTRHFHSLSSQADPLNIMKHFPGQAVVVPIVSSIPLCLTPTPLQREIPHATWIDLIPFPKMRDNLILRHDRFNHWAFMHDIIGDLLDKMLFPGRTKDKFVQDDTSLLLEDGLDDGVTANRTGLILWGEPFKPESWEATPAFLSRWDWVVQGCEELIEYTNRWRAVRGERKIGPSEARTAQGGNECIG